MSRKEIPFEGVLGNTSELRLLEHMISLSKFDFNITELSRVSGVTRPPVDKVVKKFADWEILKTLPRRGNMTFYKLNEDSPIVRTMIAFNNALIQNMFPETRQPIVTIESTTPAIASDVSTDISEWTRPMPYQVEAILRARLFTPLEPRNTCREPFIPTIPEGGTQ